MQTICTIPQDGSPLSKNGCVTTPAGGSGAASTGCPPRVCSLFAALVQAEGIAIERGQTAAQGAFGAMLLREDAGGYVLVAVAAFAAAVVLVMACVRLHEREKRRNRSKEREKENTP